MNSSPPPRPVMQAPPGPETVIDGRTYLYFGGTSYLGLHGEPSIIEAACAAMRRYGVHTATSRRGYGNNPPTLEVERLAAAFFGTADAFYFVSGYLGTAVLIHALEGDFDVILADEHCHFSMREAARLPGRPIHPFRHRDPAGLADSLRVHAPPPARPLVLTDGVFPSSGGIAPLGAYLGVLADRPGAILLVDDAHGVGAIGHQGRGTLEHLGLWSDSINAEADECSPGATRLCLCATLSKALGGFGGIVTGSGRFMARARSASHYFDAASAPPTAAAAASARALELVRARPDLRDRLAHNVRRVRQGLRDLGLSIEDGPAPIVAASCGPAEYMERLYEELKARGILVPYVRSYCGVGPEGVLRIAVCAGHSDTMIDALLAELRRLL